MMGDSPVSVKPQGQRFVKQDYEDTRAQGSNATQSLDGLDRQTSVKTEQFQKQCLTEVPDDVLSRISESKDVQKQIDKVKDVKSENDGYEFSVRLLNSIVVLLKKHYPNAYEEEEAIVFIAKPDNPPRHHPRGYSIRPDILALRERILEQLNTVSLTPSWHHLVSVGEWKPDESLALSDAESGQEREYVGCAIQARPDDPSILGVIICRGGYILSWGSPCGYVVTDQLPFTNINPLIRYVHSLHAPLPSSISFVDPERSFTVTLDDTIALGDVPRWRITDAEHGIENRLFSVIFVGSPFTRMTTVFVIVDEVDGVDGEVTVVKISYLDDKVQREAGLYHDLGKAPPGWAIRMEPIRDSNVHFKFQSLPPLDFDSTSFIHRVRHWLVLKSTGNSLEKCQSLSEVVGVTYDILEANRWAIVERRVFHRDISPKNILVHPRPPSVPKDGACFITGVYEGSADAPSLAILLDLDNGVKLPHSHISLKDFENLNSGDSCELKALSGTPMYIARGPSLGRYNLAMSRTFGDLPKIEPSEAWELYTKAYPDDTFRSKQGNMGQYDEKLRAECEQRLPHTWHLIQRPWHDAESTIIVFLIFLLRCKPRDSSPETQEDLNYMQAAYQHLRKTPIGDPFDCRDLLLKPRPDLWDSLLHTEIRDLTPFILRMCEALQVDYELLVPAEGVNQEVILHEILQRHLFALYYTLRKGTLRDVELDTECLRPVRINDNRKMVQSVDHVSSSKFSSDKLKRKDASDGVAEACSNSQSQKRLRSGNSSASRLQPQSQPVENTAEGMTSGSEAQKKTKIIDNMKPRQRSCSTPAKRGQRPALND